MTHITDFTKLCYDILNNATLCLEMIKVASLDSKNKKVSFSKNDLLSFYKNLSQLKIKVYTLKTHLMYLTIFLADKIIAISASQSYNELYFLVELIQDTLVEIDKKEITDKEILLKQINKSIESSDELRKQLDLLLNVFFNQITKYYPDMNLDNPTFSTGTDIFSWYYPQYPQNITAMQVSKNGKDILSWKDILKIITDIKNS